MAEPVIRFADYERKTKNPDAVAPRDPADSAVIIILPTVPLKRFADDHGMALGNVVRFIR